MKIDISNLLMFTQGVAQFERIDRNARTGVEAWRRSYLMEPWRNCIEIIVRESGKYYPDSAKVLRRFPDNEDKWQRIEYYLQNGTDNFFPGDEPEGLFNGKINLK